MCSLRFFFSRFGSVLFNSEPHAIEHFARINYVRFLSCTCNHFYLTCSTASICGKILLRAAVAQVFTSLLRAGIDQTNPPVVEFGMVFVRKPRERGSSNCTASLRWTAINAACNVWKTKTEKRTNSNIHFYCRLMINGDTRRCSVSITPSIRNALARSMTLFSERTFVPDGGCSALIFHRLNQICTNARKRHTTVE